MTPQQQRYWDLGMQTLELIRAALHGCRSNLPDDTDLDQLLQFARFHGVSAMVAMGLEQCTVPLPEAQAQIWSQEKSKSLRRSILFEAERQNVGAYLTQIGCCHVFLKGSILQSDYPQMGMRRMNDVDILVDRDHREQIREWMVQRGYTVVMYEKGNVDVYQKAPMYHFEIHTALYGGYRDSELAAYYQNLEHQLLAPSGGSVERQMNREDFYLYLLTHAYKHLCRRGIGIRNLVDLYVFRTSHGTPDQEYINRELDKLNIREFAEACDAISEKVLTRESEENLNNKEKALLLEFFTSGTFGTGEQVILRQVQNGTYAVTPKKQISYIFRRLLPTKAALTADYPSLGKYPWLLPFIWVVRILRGVFLTPRKLLRELSSLLKLSSRNP